MNRRVAWLGLVVLAAQLAAGCCHYRPCGLGWRWRDAGFCAPACAAPVAPSCPSCFYGPQAAVPAVMGPPVSLAPGAVVVPSTVGPVVVPNRDATPLPMPKSAGF